MGKSRGTIWMVNFSDARRALHAGWLKEAGYRLLTQEPPADGSAAAYDAIYLDLTDGEAAGLRQLRRLRRKDRLTSVVVSMAASSEDRIDAAVRQGALDYLPSDCERYRLLTTTRNAVDRSRLARRTAAIQQGAPPEELAGIDRTLSEIERDAIAAALKSAHHDLDEVVRRLGIGRATLYRKLKKYRLR